MPFVVIKGAFRVVNQTVTGKPTGFEPDGDSMQFRPDDPKLLDRLTQLKDPYRLTKIGSTQLRFEGIDALEIHFLAGSGGVSHQPRPLADLARDHRVTRAKLDPVAYTAPRNIRVKPPAIHDGARGYILSRSLEVHGRPVAFVFTGDPKEKDGAEAQLTAAQVGKSLNCEMLRAGHAYPLFYDGLFADLRLELATASAKAKAASLGLWTNDLTLAGLKASSLAELETKGMVFPKLFRRLAEFFGSGHADLGGFTAWLATKDEPVLDLDTTNFTHFDTYVKATKTTVKLTKSPDRLVFGAAKGAAAWL